LEDKTKIKTKIVLRTKTSLHVCCQCASYMPVVDNRPVMFLRTVLIGLNPLTVSLAPTGVWSSIVAKKLPVEMEVEDRRSFRMEDRSQLLRK